MALPHQESDKNTNKPSDHKHFQQQAVLHCPTKRERGNS